MKRMRKIKQTRINISNSNSNSSSISNISSITIYVNIFNTFNNNNNNNDSNSNNNSNNTFALSALDPLHSQLHHDAQNYLPSVPLSFIFLQSFTTTKTKRNQQLNNLIINNKSQTQNKSTNIFGETIAQIKGGGQYFIKMLIGFIRCGKC